MKIIEEIIIPQESVNDENVVILELFFKNGDQVKKGDEVLEIETSKATLTIEAQNDGFVDYCCKEGDYADIGALVAKIVDKYEQKEIANNTVTTDGAVNVVTTEELTFETVFSEKATQLIAKNNLQISAFKDKDFVNEHDVLLHLNPNAFNQPVEKNSKNNVKKVTTTTSNKENVRIEKLPTQKLREIEYLAAVQQYGLNSAISTVLDLENVLPFLNTNLSKLKGSILPVIIYELSRLLRKFPKLNAYYENESIVFYNDINVGIAIDMDKGLKVLKIADTEQQSMVGVEESIIAISKKYFDNKVTPSDAANITFTISDLSNEGVSTFLPLINKNNAAILAVSALDKFNGMSITLTFDHRLTEGKYVATFLRELKARIESYTTVNDSVVQGNSKKDAVKCYKCRRKLGDENFTFLKVIDASGEDQVMCNLCYEGF